MHILILSLLVAAIGAFATPSTEPAMSTEPVLSNEHKLDNITDAASIQGRDGGTWGGFADSCTDIRYYLNAEDWQRYLDEGEGVGTKPFLKSPHVVAKCPNLAGQKQCSVLKIGDCMGNRGGRLEPAYKGEWHKTCTSCAFQEDGRVFYCQCYTGKGGKLEGNIVNLNEIINNFDGKLACFSNFGKPDYCPGGPSFDIGQWGYRPWPVHG
ncbi:Cyanovirin-N [Dactylonectria estremocensis]|uniref:Cyanovirin-N n=1 Tax=Dactylonectria estremocensis TaxID=1079267 RepID=A0A9P9II66_9HYPO|nr:Cyanovirin-N [Dactylonectria estremocensis]